MATQNESPAGDAGVYGKPERNLVGYGAETPDPKWPNNVSTICSRWYVPTQRMIRVKQLELNKNAGYSMCSNATQHTL